MTDANASVKIYIDTNIFIEAFEGSPEKAEHLEPIFAAFDRCPSIAVTSELTLAEVLGRESPKGWAWQKRFYLNLIVVSKAIELHPVSRDVLEETGSYRRSLRRSGRKASLPDAIHIVTAVRARCRYIFSSDSRLIVPRPLELIAADDPGIADIKKLIDA